MAKDDRWQSSTDCIQNNRGLRFVERHKKLTPFGMTCDDADDDKLIFYILGYTNKTTAIWTVHQTSATSIIITFAGGQTLSLSLTKQCLQIEITPDSKWHTKFHMKLYKYWHQICQGATSLLTISLGLNVRWFLSSTNQGMQAEVARLQIHKETS